MKPRRGSSTGSWLPLPRRHLLNPRLMSFPSYTPASSPAAARSVPRGNVVRGACNQALRAQREWVESRRELTAIKAGDGRTKPFSLICRQHSHRAVIRRQVGWRLEGCSLPRAAPNQPAGESQPPRPGKGTGGKEPRGPGDKP